LHETVHEMAEVASQLVAAHEVQTDTLNSVLQRSMAAMLHDQEFAQRLKSGQPVLVASLASLMASKNLQVEACDELRTRVEAAAALLSIYQVAACVGDASAR